MLHCTIYFSSHSPFSSAFLGRGALFPAFPGLSPAKKAICVNSCGAEQRKQFVSIFQGLAGRFQQEEQEEQEEKENP